MAKSFLRSGNLDAVLALGENGQPVYASALQLRETLRLRKQQKIADCLAIPQPNERGDRIDWYAPVSGRVKSWIAASDSERASAINLLESYQQSVSEISQRAQSAEKPAMRLFGVLLSKAFQFPDQNYVYLVDGKPVITFWGFVDLDKKSRADALDCLRASLQISLPPILPEPEPQPEPLVAPVYEPVVVATPTPVPAPEPESVAEPVVAVVETPAPAAAPVSKSKPRWLHFWWLLPPVAVAGAFAAVQFYQAPAEPVPVASENSAPAPVATVVTPPAVVPTPAPAPVASLPLQPATHAEPEVTASSEKHAEPVAEAESVPVAAPAGKNEMVMPADAVKIGTTKFLNGNWRVTLDMKNLPSNMLPAMRYQLKDGKGTARIVQGDGNSCRADIAAGLHSSGTLIINSRYTARCSDGSRYKMPEIACKATSGAASCEARFGETVYPMTMKRENK
ncbi:SrfA family protein [Erwinia sp. V71]|uniref:SrfA family protein n=1 Tax=Erwinia sp. V71 TaxID=3369424 RepID=UPI003F5F5950